MSSSLNNNQLSNQNSQQQQQLLPNPITNVRGNPLPHSQDIRNYPNSNLHIPKQGIAHLQTPSFVQNMPLMPPLPWQQPKTVYEVLSDYSKLQSSDRALIMNNIWLTDKRIVTTSFKNLGLKVVDLSGNEVSQLRVEIPPQLDPLNRNIEVTNIAKSNINDSNSINLNARSVDQSIEDLADPQQDVQPKEEKENKTKSLIKNSSGQVGIKIPEALKTYIDYSKLTNRIQVSEHPDSAFVEGILTNPNFKKVIKPPISMGKTLATPIFVNIRTGYIFTSEGRQVKLTGGGFLSTKKIFNKSGRHSWIYQLVPMTENEKKTFSKRQKGKDKSLQKKSQISNDSKESDKIPGTYINKNVDTTTQSDWNNKLPYIKIKVESNNNNGQAVETVPDWNKCLIPFGKQTTFLDIPVDKKDQVMDQWCTYIQARYNFDLELLNRKLYLYHNSYCGLGLPPMLIVDGDGNQIDVSLDKDLDSKSDCVRIATRQWYALRESIFKDMEVGKHSRHEYQFKGTYYYTKYKCLVYNGKYPITYTKDFTTRMRIAHDRAKKAYEDRQIKRQNKPKRKTQNSDKHFLEVIGSGDNQGKLDLHITVPTTPETEEEDSKTETVVQQQQNELQVTSRETTPTEVLSTKNKNGSKGKIGRKNTSQ
jgi:hypothetical protein